MIRIFCLNAVALMVESGLYGVESERQHSCGAASGLGTTLNIQNRPTQ